MIKLLHKFFRWLEDGECVRPLISDELQKTLENKEARKALFKEIEEQKKKF